MVPVYFKSADRSEFDSQMVILRKQLAEVAEFAEPVLIGSKLPDVDALIFPQLVGELYKRIDELKKIGLPFLAITSEFGTINMWDWEIVSFMKSEGCTVFSPYSLEMSKKICRSLGVKREMRSTTFLMFQDNPKEGMQANIFKRFYWWEDRCLNLIKKRFGVIVVKKSFKQFGEEAKNIPDREAEKVWRTCNLPTQNLSKKMLNSAVKVYIALKQEVEKDKNIRGIGINCLNESFYSDTTPCLAWNMLFEEKGIIWACEADIMALLTKYMIYHSLKVPIMMSNIYPFLMGQAALMHERILKFPEVEGNPSDYSLIAHCGYLGMLPKSFSTDWTLRPKVLSIVDDNAIAIDARLPEGDMTIAKLDPTISKLLIVEGSIIGYTQFPGSDCRNGAVIKVPNGYQLLDKLYSHHILLMTGHLRYKLENMAQALGLEIDAL